MVIQFNSVHDPYMPGYGTWAISAANGCPTGCVTNTDYNVLVDNIPAASGGQYVAPAIEVWGSNGTGASANLIQGDWSTGIAIATTGQFTFNLNTFELNLTPCANTEVPNGGSCSTGAAYFNNEDGPTFTATASGNTFLSASSAVVSVAPTVSLSGATFTLANPGTERDANTSIWFTTDGSTPVPGAGTAQIYTAPFTVAATTTVKAVGMWGAANQPTSYASGYGYVPSAVVLATYTAAAPPPPPPATITLPAGTYILVVPGGASITPQ
jgi:hypothetical protein